MKLTCTASDGAKWEIYEDDDKKWRWRCMVKGRIVLASHKGYKSRERCIENARRPGLDADAEPNKRADGTRTCKGSNGDKWVFRKKKRAYSGAGRKRKWRWKRYERTVSGKWQTVGRSSQGYRKFRRGCLGNARRPGMDCEPDVLDQFMD